MNVIFKLAPFQVRVIAWALGLTLTACSPDTDTQIPEAASARGQDASPFESVSSTDTIEAARGNISNPNDTASGQSPETADGSPAESDPDSVVSTPSTDSPPGNSSLPTAPLPQPGPIDLTIADGVYLIKNVESGRCMEVPEGRADEGLRLQIATCSQSSFFQMVTINQIDSSYYRLSSAYDKSFEGKRDDLDPGSPFQQGTATGTSNQQFILEDSGDGISHLIRLKANNLVLEPVQNLLTNGTLLQFNAENPRSAQRWLLMKL